LLAARELPTNCAAAMPAHHAGRNAKIGDGHEWESG
jgi:hypothetical protein